MDRITIVGMGPISTSIGLGLKQSNLPDIEIVGTSGNNNSLKTVLKMGAVDSTTGNLGSAVTNANLVILDTHVGETQEILSAISPLLSNDCIITDISHVKVPILEWADKNLPETVSFVGGRPLPKTTPVEIEEANPSIFEGADYCIIPSKSANESAIKTVVSMVEKLGSIPLFLDPYEHDSYAAAMTYLPIVMSSAYVTTVAANQSWREMHRLAASEFQDLSKLASNDPEDSRDASIANPEALTHWIDQLITTLYGFRNQIKNDKEILLTSFINAWEAHAKWESGAVGEETNQTKMPTAGETMANFMVGGRLADRYREYTQRDKNKKSGWKYRRKT